MGLTQPKEAGKFELLDGVVIVQQSQKWKHAAVKLEITFAFREAIKVAGMSFHLAPDGITVRINERKCFEPDALVAALPVPDGDSLEIRNPVIVVEVLSPSTAQIDTTAKLQGYFEVPSVQHYLIVDPGGRTITHHKRASRDILETRIVSEGALTLAPPGLTIDVKALFA